MKVICIMGIDGAGKTTLARNTAAALQHYGVHAVYFYGRQYPVFSRALLQAVSRLPALRGQDEWHDYYAYTDAKRLLLQRPGLALAYPLAVLLDYYLRSWRRLLPYLFRPGVVVADRYLYDTVVGDLAVYLDYAGPTTARLIAWGLKLVPQPLVTVLLDVPPDVALGRKDDVPHLDYVGRRRALYEQIKDRPEIVQLSGELSPEALVRALVHETAVRSRAARHAGRPPRPRAPVEVVAT